MAIKRLAGVVVALFVLTGCPAGLQAILTPETPAETLAVIEISVKDAVAIVGDLARAKIIVGDNAALALEAIEAIEQSLVVARLAVKGSGDPQPALGAVQAALGALLAIAEQHQRPSQ